MSNKCSGCQAPKRADGRGRCFYCGLPLDDPQMDSPMRQIAEDWAAMKMVLGGGWGGATSTSIAADTCSMSTSVEVPAMYPGSWVIVRPNA